MDPETVSRNRSALGIWFGGSSRRCRDLANSGSHGGIGFSASRVYGRHPIIWRNSDAGNRELEWSKRMKVELVHPDPETEPRHWLRHDQAFAMMLAPGSIEWGSQRSRLEKFDYAVCDLALCDRHEGEWVGAMTVPHLQLGISDTALVSASHKPNGEVELRPRRKFADSRLGALVTAVHAEMMAGFPN